MYSIQSRIQHFVASFGVIWKKNLILIKLLVMNKRQIKQPFYYFSIFAFQLTKCGFTWQRHVYSSGCCSDRPFLPFRAVYNVYFFDSTYSERNTVYTINFLLNNLWHTFTSIFVHICRIALQIFVCGLIKHFKFFANFNF